MLIFQNSNNKLDHYPDSVEEFVEHLTFLQKMQSDMPTLEKFMGLLTVAVEKKISTDIPKKIGLIIDGWTHGTTRYCACLLLSKASFLNECDLGVSSMRDFIDARYLFLAVMWSVCSFLSPTMRIPIKPSRIC